MLNIITFYLNVIIFLFCIKICYGKEIIIKNEDDLFYKFSNIVINYEGNEELILKFPDKKYDMLELDFSLELPVKTNITFIGTEKTTIFDFGNEIKGSFKIFKSVEKSYFVKFENIIFQNYSKDSYENKVSIFHLESTYNNMFITFNNCTFRNNNYEIITIDVLCSKNDVFEPNLIINNCQF